MPKKPGPVTVTERLLSDYDVDPNNANKGRARGQQMIEDSIRDLGTGRSILADADNVLIAGNHALQAAIDAGITRAIEIEVPPDAMVVVKRTDLHLSEGGKARRLAIADNRTQQANLDFDVDKLLEDMDSIQGLFRQDEIDALMETSAALEQVDSALAAEETEGNRLTSERQKQIKPVLYAEDIATFEDAIQATGLVNRGDALIAICKAYLEGKTNGH